MQSTARLSRGVFLFTLVMSFGCQSIAWANSNPFSIPTSDAKEALQALRANPAIARLLGAGETQLTAFQRLSSHSVDSTKFQAYFKGLEVVGSMAIYHRGTLRKQITNHLARFDLDVRPTLTADDAVSLARTAVDADRVGVVLESKPTLKVLPDEQDTSSAKLVYWVTFAGTFQTPGFEVVLDAHSGATIAVVSDHIELAPVQVYATNEKCQKLNPLTGMPMSLEVKDCDRMVTDNRPHANADDSALRALENSERVLDYYKSVHGRDSYDGRGAEVVNIVHVGEKFENAFWNGKMKIMAYGDGDGVETGDFTRALDVAGHEMTHGVVSATAKFQNFGESGALNEAYADYFGKMIVNDGDWTIGRDLYLDRTKAKGFRDLQQPHNLTVTYRNDDGEKVTKQYPNHIDERFVATGECSSRNDNCWVHVNATIPGHASYLVTQELGKAKAEKLYYTTLTQYLNTRANIRTAADATKQACSMLYDDSTCARVEAALAKVGL